VYYQGVNQEEFQVTRLSMLANSTLIHIYLQKGKHIETILPRVARFCLIQLYQTGEYIPNDRKLNHHFPFQGPQKFTKIGIFGFKL
jgi:hypothetical protein